MNTSFLTSILVSLCLGCGFFVGLLAKGKVQPSAIHDGKQATKSQTNLKSSQSSNSRHPFINEATSSLYSAPEFSLEVKRLYKELKSPLRASSLIEQLIHEKTFDEWELLLKDRQVLNQDLLSSLGQKFAKEDPDRALKMLLFDKEIRVENMEQHYSFRDGLMRTIAVNSPEKGLAALQAMERGGGQMDHSLYLSSQWAKADPAEAAKHFEELVQLRNMTMNGDLNMPRDHFARQVIGNWVRKDHDAATSYVEELPAGATKTTFMNTLKAFSKK